MKVDLPVDLVAFVAANLELQYDEDSCEAGMVRLHRPEGLQEVVFRAQTYGTPLAGRDPNAKKSGTYAVPGVDLIARCTGDYEPEGLLVWFPLEQRYGVADTDHDYILLFELEVEWADIVASPAPYINAQWSFEELSRASTEYLEPWHHYKWQG